MEEEQYMTLEQRMTLKAILEGDYKIHRIGYTADNDTVYIRVDEQNAAYIQPDGRITRKIETEVEL